MRKYGFLFAILTIFLGIFAPAVCPVGDLDGDCSVGMGDLVLFAGDWLEEAGGANLDGLGGVDGRDLAILAGNWGQSGLRLVINELMTDNVGTIEDADEAGEYPDWIELYNPTALPVDVGGMYLTDTLSAPTLWQVPADAPGLTTIAPGGYLLIWADGEPAQGTLHAGFKLSASGEAVGLFDRTGELVDSVSFGSLGADVSYGRYPNGGAGWQSFRDGTATPGASNGGALADAGVVISEIMYHPGHNAAAFEAEPLGLEFIELYNRGTGAVDLSGWRFTDGVAFEMPAGTVIGAGGYCVVAADAAAFASAYPAAANAAGGWTGKLSNQGETVTLVNGVGTVIDSVTYSDEGDWSQRVLGPVDHNHRGWMWSDAHDGGGRSLELVCAEMDNEVGQNWKASLDAGGTLGRNNSTAVADAAPFVLDVAHAPVMPSNGQAVTVTAKLVDEATAGLSAVLYWRADASVYVKTEYPSYDAASYTTAAMADDGLHGDGQAGDGVYGANIPAQADGTVVEFFVEAKDAAGNMRTWPAACEVDGQLRQAANGLYQVNDAFAGETARAPGKQPTYYLVMTEAERRRIEVIGGGDSYERYSDAQMNATFVSEDGVDTKVRYAVGVRNRGEGSRRQPPNNYRVNFRHDAPWKGVTAININSKYTYLQLAGSAIFRLAGLTAAEATAVQVRVNGRNLAATDSIPSRMYNTYVHMEAIDGEFAANHFPGDGGGNIYKASIYPQVADLTYLGINPADYVARGYTKGSNESANDWSDLFELTNVLENEPDETYLQRLEAVVNTEQWIRWYAVQTLIGNNETNLGTGYGDDYRMYRGVVDPRFVLVTHDMDTILGQGDSPAGVNDSIWRAVAPHTNVHMVVIQRFLQHPEYVWRYYAELKRLAETVYAPETINPLLDSLLGDFVPESRLEQMKQFAADRRAAVLSQIPMEFSAGTGLSKVNGYYRTTTSTAPAISGTADAAVTRAVRVNGLPATWSGVTGVWSIGAGIALRPGINRVVVQTFGDPEAAGGELRRGHVDIWYDDGSESTLAGGLAADTVLDAASGPWHVTGDVVIPAGVTLTIETGTTVFFDAGTGITVNGRLVAEGTEFARIRLTRTPGGSRWDGIELAGTLEDSRMTCVDMEYGDGQGCAVDVKSSRVTMDRMTWVSSNGTTRILELTHPSALIRHCTIPTISGTEPVHGTGLSGEEYLIFEGNTFGSTTGYNDIVDFTGGQRPGPIIQFYNNTFLGGGDDGPDLDGTDAHVEGNFLTNFHQTTPDQDSPSYAVATGDGSQVCVVRNVFVDNDHAILHKENVYSWTQNNTIIGSTIAAVSFGEPFRSTPREPGKGTWLASNIFWNNAALFEHYFDYPVGYGPTGTVGVDHSLLPEAWHSFGRGDLDGAPLFRDVTSDRTLLAGSPARGTGLNGQDMGAFVPAGASVSGEPAPVTHRTTAMLTVGGPGITHYRWRLVDNGLPGAWSGEIALPVTPDDYPADPEQVCGEIQLTGLQDGHTYRVDVVGKNSAGLWQGQPFRDTGFTALGSSEGNSSASWTVDLASRVLRIDEVLASNASIAHEGTYPDWIELYYDGPEAIDLGGYRLTDDETAADKFVFAAGTIMNPGERLVVWADVNPGTSGIHAGFALDTHGDTVCLLSPAGELVDSVVFGRQLADRSISRTGSQDQWTLTEPTPGAANRPAARGDFRELKINEWLTDGEILFVEDWVEVYNPSPWPVDMGGLYVTDDPVGEPDKFRMRPLSFVDGSGYTVFTADGSNANGHLPFRLSSDGEMLALFDADLALIDQVLLRPNMTDASQGCSPDGGETLRFFDLPTPGAANAHVNVTTTVDPLIAIDDVWSYEQSGTDLGTAWREASYDDAGWPTGAAVLYVEGSSLPAAKHTPLTLGVNTYYFRRHFTFAGDPAAVDHLELMTLIDDGAAIYLNGQELLKVRLGDTVSYSTNASASVSNAVFEAFTAGAAALRQGDNVIAVEVHQINSTSSDIVFGLEMEAVSTVTTFEDLYADDRAVLNGLRVTEIMYHPAADPNSEFIELQNVGQMPIDLEGVRFTSGVEFVFPAMQLEPGQYTVVVASREAFEARYGTQLSVAGEYTGKLSNAGEAVVLQLAKPLDAAVLRFAYSAGWYPSTDGGGHSLVIDDPSSPPAAWQDAAQWRPSAAAGGSPGRADAAAVLISEVLAHSHDAAPDWIELYNASDAAVDIGGWYLSDDPASLAKYQIAEHTTIGPKGYLVFYEDVHFGNPADPGCLDAFALSENGESLTLSAAEAGQLSGYTVEVSFGASETGVSFGRYAKSDGTAVFVLMDAATPGAANAGPKVGPVVISEIMYHPPAGGSYAAQDYEYIELRNVTGSPVTLEGYDPSEDVTLGWRFTGGIEYTFPLGITIESYGTLIVAANPAAFAERYGSGLQVLGPFANATHLSNSGELVELSKPGDTDAAGTRYYIGVDSVYYGDGAPWPAAPDGGEQALDRVNESGYGDDAANWQAQAPSPGV